MFEEGYVECLKYLIGESVQYYRISKQKSYTGVMHRINMGCSIYPREKNFWDIEADKTRTAIDRYIYDMNVYDAREARRTTNNVKDTLADIDVQCDPYRWYEARNAVVEEVVKEPEWNAEDFAIGVEYLH